ncbi:MAG: hypothetical protein JXR34_13625 [Bacteroidales bacterium]|nr:hypothetical protein [Bacteroidales bacterium]
MKMIFKIFPKEHLLIDMLEGDLVYSDLTRLIKTEFSHENINQVKKVLSIITKANLKVSAQEIKAYSDFLASKNQDTQFYWAILTDQPHSTALSYLLQINSNFKINISVFSTLEACSAFLSIPITDLMLSTEDYIEV